MRTITDGFINALSANNYESVLCVYSRKRLVVKTYHNLNIPSIIKYLVYHDEQVVYNTDLLKYAIAAYNNLN